MMTYWVGTAVVWLLALANAWLIIKNERDMKRSIPDMVSEVHQRLLSMMGRDIDLIERVVTDLVFMHSQLYPGKHHCPICGTTIPELEALARTMRTSQVEIIPGSKQK